MPNRIKIKKGLNIPIEGKAPESLIGRVIPDLIRICPEDFHGLVPKVEVRVGDVVKAGTPLMFDKNNPDLKFVSPVSGSVISITRGDKRKLLDVTIQADKEIQAELFDKVTVESSTRDELKDLLLKSGLWPFIKQRPYDIIANPNKEPRDIFVTGFSTAPLAPSFDFIIDKEPDHFQLGLDVLAKMTNGKVFLSIGDDIKSEALRKAKNVELFEFNNLHPAGNVGVQINKIKPINKGETVWTVSALDVLLIGRFFQKGHIDFTRLVAYTGSEAVKRGYYNIVIGSEITSLFDDNVVKGSVVRCISGDALTGTNLNHERSLRFYDSQITVIPEGDTKHDLLGWASLGLNNKYSAGCTYMSSLVKLFNPKKLYRFDTRLMGGPRAMIMSNQYDRVFPMDIYPEYLIKSCIAFNIDKMEQLGIYEVAPEDFALCEFVDTSKLEIQKIIRESLLKLYKEME